MKINYSVFLITMFVMSGPVLAAEYYYCDCQAGANADCEAGDDNSDGTSADAPRRSYELARTSFAGLSGGDIIRFCRGGSFVADTGTRWVNASCSGSTPCSVTDYEPGWQTIALPRPIITRTDDEHLFNFADGGNADHEEGYQFSNLDLRCTQCNGSSGNGFFFYNDVDDVSIDNVAIDGFRIGVHLAGSNPVNSGSDGTLDRIDLTRLSITNSKSQGILGGANDLSITDSYFENNGGGTVFEHNLYISRGTNIIVRNNELYRSSLNAANACNGTSFVVHGTIDNMLIQGNTIHEDVGLALQTCYGISVNTGYARAEAFNNVTIRGNKIINVGNVGIGTTSCRDCVIENNIVFHEQAFGITAISVPNNTRATDDQAMQHVTVSNNSIYITSSGTGIRLGSEGTQHLLVSNAIHYSGTGRFTCIDANLPGSSYQTIGYNICYFPNASAQSEWEQGSGVTPNPLAAWQTASGLGTGSGMLDPDYLQPSLPAIDLSPASGSAAMVDAGHANLSSLTDIRGMSRDANPDIGAYEFGIFNPPSAPVLYIE